ncbi:MAG: lysophospholipid acyltransferase family protein [Paracoccaceae bacterium]|jgi:Kdo2-lipid IVA lauroyltransferase/acyltransferase|nr:lysophospholipid acyltransferase family protein [Paracoccaceae bacterium]MDP5369753.1 lysophospholipid acyltransferase family protein [Paracoccaceae bacterium]
MVSKSFNHILSFGQNMVLIGVIRIILLLPYKWRGAVCGEILSRLISPLAGYNRRIKKNLKLIYPDLSKQKVADLMLQVPKNVGRTLIEVYSGTTFKNHVRNTQILGTGLPALLAARQTGQGVILVSGHFGNYDVPRAVLSNLGYPVACLYKPFRNVYFDQHYFDTIGKIASPIFPATRNGLAQMVRHIKSGGLIGILVDQHISHGTPLDFLGRSAKTALSAAEMALKYNCLLVPTYGVRHKNGNDFDLIIEDPIPHSDAKSMTQALNDSLAAQVRANMDQWFWIHNRWK